MSNQSFFRNKGSKVRRYGRLLNVTANATLAIPRNCLVKAIYFHNRTANAVTGGIKVGTTNGGVDILAAGAVAASAAYEYPSLLATGLISATDLTLYIQAVSAWNSARVDVVVEYVEYPRDTYDIPGLNRGA